jgi:hypothetical protein
VKLLNGPKSQCTMFNVNVSYQVFRNLFVDLGGTYRNYKNRGGIYDNNFTTTGPVNGPLTTNYVYFGVRINAPRRDYDFF